MENKEITTQYESPEVRIIELPSYESSICVLSNGTERLDEREGRW